jgi:hypothetical protein
VIRLRTGDRAIIVGAVAIAVYERVIADDADLISSRVAAYKRNHPVLTMAIVWITAAHLTELLHPSVDPYHQAVKYFRRHVGGGALDLGGSAGCGNTQADPNPN